MRQTIIWTNAEPVHRRIYVALGGDELTIYWLYRILIDLLQDLMIDWLIDRLTGTLTNTPIQNDRLNAKENQIRNLSIQTSL